LRKLRKISTFFGTEIDIRSNGSKLILNHEPNTKGDKLEDYLSEYKHGTLILNIKEAGIENEVIKKVKQAKINSYFLLDVEYPYIFKSIKKKQKNIAIRFSEIESINNAKLLQKNFNWIWIDTITKLPINKENLKVIKKYNSCVVCPERWGRPREIKSYWKKMIKLKFVPNAIMCEEKYANMWNNLFN
tara:strand:+ start:8253 stop:8816 length:564 start_codon:yes stop_codon:yes gene_type:complete